MEEIKQALQGPRLSVGIRKVWLMGGLNRQFLYETFDLAASVATVTQEKVWVFCYGGLMVGHPFSGHLCGFWI